MSDVYRARDTFLENASVSDNQVAIKVLQAQFVSQPEALQLLLQEAHKTQQLSHPNIVRVFDVDCDQDCYFIGWRESGSGYKALQAKRSAADSVIKVVGATRFSAELRSF